MSLRCSSSMKVPEIPIVTQEGIMYDDSVLRAECGHNPPPLGALLSVKDGPGTTYPTVGACSRNIGVVLALMRSSMDRIILENLAIKSELAKLRKKISREIRSRDGAHLLIHELLMNSET